MLAGLGFDIGIDADDDGQAVDPGLGGLVAIAAGDREGLPGRGRTWCVQRYFDVEDVVLDGGLHVLVVGLVGGLWMENGLGLKERDIPAVA